MMKQKILHWVIAATLVFGVSVLTSCSSNDDNPINAFPLQPGDTWDAATGTLYVNSNPGKNAYKRQTAIASVVFSDAVTSIGDSAFYDCLINVVDLPASVVSIGSEAFAGEESDFNRVTILATDCTFGEHPFVQSIMTNIYVPQASLAAYQAAYPDYARQLFAIPEAQQHGNEIVWSDKLCDYIWACVPYNHPGKNVAAHNTQGGITVTLTGTKVDSGINWLGVRLAQGEKLTFTSTVGNISQITIQSTLDDEDEEPDTPVAEGWTWDSAKLVFTWQGTPSATVEMIAGGDIDIACTQITFTIDDGTLDQHALDKLRGEHLRTPYRKYKFVDCAFVCQADFIVTDDRHFDDVANSPHFPLF